MGRLDGKVAIITGAGAGMRREEAILFAREGAKIVVVDTIAKRGEETVKIVTGAGGKAIFVKADVSKTQDVKNMVKQAVDTFGRLDILVNGAAIAPNEGSVVDLTEELFDKTIAINLKGVWLGMKYAIPEMAQ